MPRCNSETCECQNQHINNCKCWDCARGLTPVYDHGRRYDDRNEYIADTMRAILDEMSKITTALQKLTQESK